MKGETGISPWKDVWERKGQVVKAPLELSDLLTINGYDTAASKVTTEDWLAYVASIKERLRISSHHQVCEIGCGAGAFSLPLYNQGMKIWGVDYAENLIRLCRAIMPAGTFAVAEARAVPFAGNRFDVVVSSGVFVYFPGLDYAESVIAEMARLLKPGGRAAILDLTAFFR